MDDTDERAAGEGQAPAGGQEDPSGQRVGYRRTDSGEPRPGEERYGRDAEFDREVGHPTPYRDLPSRSEEALTGQDLPGPHGNPEQRRDRSAGARGGQEGREG